MAIALVSNTGAGSSTSNNVTTSAISTIGATCIIIGLCDYFAVPAATLSDNQGNTYTKLNIYISGVFPQITIAYVLNPTVNASHTFTASSSGGFPTICVAAFSGVATSSAFDQQNGAGSSGASATIQPGSVTPTTNNQLVVTAVNFNTATATVSINGGFTISNQVAPGGSAHWGGGLAYLIQTSAAAANPTWTQSPATSTIVASIATFKPTATGTGLFVNANLSGLQGGGPFFVNPLG